MEPSILISTKKILGLDDAYTPFDLDIITHINGVFSILGQLGIGPSNGFMIEGEEASWDDLGIPQDQLNLVRTYVFLRVRLLFDPPTTSYLLDVYSKQIAEYEFRLSVLRENLIPDPVIDSLEECDTSW